MRRPLAGFLTAAVIAAFAAPAIAQTAPESSAATHTAAARPDPLGDLITAALTGGALPGSVEWKMRATLYHAGARAFARSTHWAAASRRCAPLRSIPR